MVLPRFECVVFAPRAGLVRGLRRSLLHGVLHQAPPARSPQTARALDHRQHGPGARLWEIACYGDVAAGRSKRKASKFKQKSTQVLLRKTAGTAVGLGVRGASDRLLALDCDLQVYRGGFLVPPEERESLIRMARATKTDDPEVAFKDDNYRTYLSARSIFMEQ